MAPPTRSAAPGPSRTRKAGVLVAGVVAILAALVAVVVAFYALEWGSDSGPVLGVFSAFPAALSAGLVRWMTARGPRAPRTAAGLLLGVAGLAAWTVALRAAFTTQSAYSSGTGDVAVLWIVAGALGALLTVASSALLPRGARSAAWAVEVVVVALLWAVFAVARFADNNAVLVC